MTSYESLIFRVDGVPNYNLRHTFSNFRNIVVILSDFLKQPVLLRGSAKPHFPCCFLDYFDTFCERLDFQSFCFDFDHFGHVSDQKVAW